MPALSLGRAMLVPEPSRSVASVGKAYCLQFVTADLGDLRTKRYW